MTAARTLAREFTHACTARCAGVVSASMGIRLPSGRVAIRSPRAFTLIVAPRAVAERIYVPLVECLAGKVEAAFGTPE